MVDQNSIENQFPSLVCVFVPWKFFHSRPLLAHSNWYFTSSARYIALRVEIGKCCSFYFLFLFSSSSFSSSSSFPSSCFTILSLSSFFLVVHLAFYLILRWPALPPLPRWMMPAYTFRKHIGKKKS